MLSLERLLQKMLDIGHRMLAGLSTHWKEHTNRRTIIILLVSGLAASLLYLYVIQAPDSFPVGQLVTIEEGASLQSVAEQFQEQGVVRSGFALRLLVSFTGGDRNVHAGDYLFKEPSDVFFVARAIETGAYGLEPTKIRVPEGATVAQMVKLFSPQLQRFNAEHFVAQARSSEGYLFPDTYNFLPNATDAMVEEALRNNFDLHIAEIAPQIASSTHSLSDIVIMASILEREAQNTQDRRIIAGILWKRIAIGMALQVDATFSYTIGKGTFQLRTADLVSDSPYNTYKYKGLPPGPIGSPSLDSLLAAATPLKSDYLFYLADNNHVTHYSKTYQEHLRKKALYLGT